MEGGGGCLNWLTTCWLRKINAAPWKLLLPVGLVTPLCLINTSTEMLLLVGGHHY
jgi:hypothetical protein